MQSHGKNLTDTRTNLITSSYEWIKAITVNWSRTIDLGFSYRF